MMDKMVWYLEQKREHKDWSQGTSVLFQFYY